MWVTAMGLALLGIHQRRGSQEQVQVARPDLQGLGLYCIIIQRTRRV
jgi:hypothetical protein